MLEVLINGEANARTQLNNSLSKQHFSFSKFPRFNYKTPSYTTEYTSNLRGEPLTIKSHSVLKSHCFETKSSKILNPPNETKPDMCTYNPKRIKKSKSITMSLSRDVFLIENRF